MIDYVKELKAEYKKKHIKAALHVYECTQEAYQCLDDGPSLACIAAICEVLMDKGYWLDILTTKTDLEILNHE